MSLTGANWRRGAALDRGDETGHGDRKAPNVPDYESTDSIPEHAPTCVVPYTYQAAVTGGTTRSIANKLTEQRVPTPCMGEVACGTWPKGRPCFATWNTTTETELRRNAQSGEMEEVSRRVVRKADDEAVVLLDNVVQQKLVDDEIWFAVQEQLARNKRESARNSVMPQGHCCATGLRSVATVAHASPVAMTVHAVRRCLVFL